MKTNVSLLLCFVFLLGTGMLFAQPADNPYKTRYGSAVHWTDTLKWYQISNVLDFGAIPDDNNDDSSAIQTAIQTVHANGGGVIYFPPGTYNVSGHLKIRTGVILRGADPVGITKATETGYSPPSKLVFPRFILDTAANGGLGNPRNKAFKSITGAYECSNAGLVNLDINRAYVGFHPRFDFNPQLPYQSPQAIEKNRNLIVMGCRINHAVILDGGIPELGTPAGSRQRPWQVFPWRFSANIDMYVLQNCVIANNRLNDAPPEDFDMPNYRIRQRNTQNWFPLGQRNSGGWKANFDYNAHYGIALNRAKIYVDSTGRHRVAGVVTYGKPENEPDLFRTGLEVLDNWVYKTSRVGITAAGIGLKIKRNVTRDLPGKDTPAMENFLGPTGNQTPQGATTLENRGIDFSGWQVQVDSNDVVCYRNYVQGYLSTDGEGILLQECCGGTQVNDYTITGNILENYIGIYKMRDINNLKIFNNNLKGNTIFIVANTNNDAHYLNNFQVEGNTEVGSIQAIGTRGGFAGFVRNNVGTGSASANLSCHVTFESNNTGFGNVVYRAIDPNNPNNHTGAVVPGPCAESTTYPKVKLIRPTSDTTYVASLTQYTVVAKLTQGDLLTAKIDLLKGTQVVAADLSPSLVDSTVSWVWTVPASGPGVTPFTARIRDGVLEAFSEVRTFTQVIPVSVADGRVRQVPVSVFPNPIDKDGFLNLVFGEESPIQVSTLTVVDGLGKRIPVAIQPKSDGHVQVSLKGLPTGLYLLTGPGLRPVRFQVR
jgi:hypothetical protein